MIYLIKMKAFDDFYSNYMISANSERDLKIKIEDMFCCISANKIDENHWEIKGFDVLESNGTIKFNEDSKDNIYVTEVDCSYVEKLCEKGMELLDPFEE